MNYMSHLRVTASQITCNSIYCLFKNEFRLILKSPPPPPCTHTHTQSLGLFVRESSGDPPTTPTQRTCNDDRVSTADANYMMTSPNGSISALLAFCEGNHRSPVDSPNKDQLPGALIFSLAYARTPGWANIPMLNFKLWWVKLNEAYGNVWICLAEPQLITMTS